MHSTLSPRPIAICPSASVPELGYLICVCALAQQDTCKSTIMHLRKSSAASGHDRRHSSIADEGQLAAMGIKQELRRNFSTISMLGLAFAILNTWTALSSSLTLALPSGGSTAILWGLITAGICNTCLASSLAEFLSAYPTAGGQVGNSDGIDFSWRY